MIETRFRGADAARMARGTRHPWSLALLALVLSTSLLASCGSDRPGRSTDAAASRATPGLSQHDLQLQILLAQLHHDSSSKRREAAAELGSLGDPAAVAALSDTLDDPDSSVRLAAAFALQRLGDPAAVPALIDALDDGDPWVRLTAVEALAEIGDPRAAARLLAFIAIEPPEVTDENGLLQLHAFVAAVRALGTLGGADVVGRLLELASSGSTWTQQPHYCVNEVCDAITDTATAAVVAIGPAAIPALATAIGSPDSEIVLAAVAVLERLGPPAVSTLAKAVGSSNSEVALAAVATLGRLGTPALDPLIAALGDKRSAVRVAAAEALGGFGRPAVKPLSAALKHQDAALRLAAAKSLGKIGDPAAISPLIAALKHKDLALRVAAATSLGQIGDPEATSSLIAALAAAKVSNEHGGDRGLFHEASRALAQIHRGDPTALVKYLKAQKTVGVYLALIRIGQADTRTVLLTALRQFGDVSMAEEYLNCGEATLEKAARDWAKAHGYTVGPSLYRPCIGPQCSGPAWGGG